MRRLGDDDGTAVWTVLTDEKEVRAAIEARAKERLAEQAAQEKFVHALLERKERRTEDDGAASARCAAADVSEAAAALAAGLGGVAVADDKAAAAAGVAGAPGTTSLVVPINKDNVDELRLKQVEDGISEIQNELAKTHGATVSLTVCHCAIL